LIKKLSKTIFNKENLYLWLGFSLSSLFFSPLVSWLNYEMYYFHWNSTDTIELICAWILLGLALSLGLYLVEKIENKTFKVLTLLLLNIIPFTAYFLYIFRVMQLDQELMSFVGFLLEYKLISLIVFVFLLIYVLKKKEIIMAIQYKLILIFSFLNIYIIFGFIGIILTSTNTTASSSLIDKKQNSDNYLHNIVFIVFDELSYQYLYENGDIKEDYKNIKTFSDDSKNYHLAYAPSSGTLYSMPSYIAGEKLDQLKIVNNEIRIKDKNGKFEKNPFLQKNIFSHARELGYQTALVGWYHNYCKFLTNVLDFCDAYSIYKFTSRNDGFSLFHPFATNLNILPSEKPSGFLKIPFSTHSHVNVVERSLSSSKYLIKNLNGALMFLHFPIPHKPFIFNGEEIVMKYDAFIENDENYKNQLLLVDRVFGEILGNLKALKVYDNSTIILTSDHNFRAMFKAEIAKQVPLMIKQGKQSSRIDVNREVQVLDELLRIIN